MPAIDVVDETFLAVPPERVAVAFADPRCWPRYWPDLDLEVMTDRGAAGIRWTVTGTRVGSMEVWLEPVGDGTVLHYFLRVDPAGRPGGAGRSARAIRRDARRDRAESQRRQRGAKAIAFALKRELEQGRAAGEPPG